ncbi:ribonuclease H-like domain-containing protein [Synechococcus sp. PCC 7336]|uniref:ribonuclease H-like domain-containing protein n=1 Tax=Synechococcus sp. PCC 7336 TaxID=195250 RepID=UPI0003457A92|nr:ribonuclease H-like domain-containing protein [Synechococcus sp. PCC 7336]
MLQSTFQHLKGIGPKKERQLWSCGIQSWDDFLNKQSLQLTLFAKDACEEIKNTILRASQKAIEEENSDFFFNRLNKKEHYRIPLSFPKRTIFLDIETTGLSRYYDTITIVGWSIGNEYRVYVKGDSERELLRALSCAKVIVTFNGSIFDLPFLRKEFPQIEIPKSHVDLRFFAKRVGLSGGQKAIETKIGLIRHESLQELNGEVAPLLWHRYRKGDLDALKTLILYNHADVEGMKHIFDFTVHKIIEGQEIPQDKHKTHHFSEYLSKISWYALKENETDEHSQIKLKSFQGNSGPLISFNDLHKCTDSKTSSETSKLRIVGIDLTGSEQRASGWCLLEGDRAITQRLYSDADIVHMTLEANPSLVSIDSPLSLPKGRKIVSDDDPGRGEYGITRYCERVLKKRGINVYPSLIKSMQGLTARGIKLAYKLRSLGVPVIESYPGAAQDIMNIPRKRVSIKFLVDGLVEFGIKGDFLNHSVTHDELDAITSAIVGCFLWTGNFEELGTDEEDYLIIPNIDTSKNMLKGRKVIGLSGPISAGKTTAGEFLKSRGFHYERFSSVLAELLRNRDIEITRESLQIFGEKINKEPGQRWLCQQLTKHLPNEGDIVIDGLRFPEDHAFFVEKFGSAFMHIHIDSPAEVRLERYISKGGNQDEFEQAIQHPVEAEIHKISKLAHATIFNKMNRDQFLSQLIEVIDCSKAVKEESLSCP